MGFSQQMGALEKNLKPKEFLSLGAPIFPMACWLQGEGTGSEPLADQSCDWRHNEQGNGVGGAETWGPMPLQRHRIPGKPFL